MSDYNIMYESNSGPGREDPGEKILRYMMVEGTQNPLKFHGETAAMNFLKSKEFAYLANRWGNRKVWIVPVLPVLTVVPDPKPLNKVQFT